MHDLNTAIVFQVTATLLKVKERIFGGMIGKSCYAHLASGMSNQCPEV